MGENSRKVWNDLFGLNIWRNLNILRDTLRRVRLLINLIPLSPAGLSRTYASSLLSYAGGGQKSFATPSLPSMCPILTCEIYCRALHQPVYPSSDPCQRKFPRASDAESSGHPRRPEWSTPWRDPRPWYIPYQWRWCRNAFHNVLFYWACPIKRQNLLWVFFFSSDTSVWSSSVFIRMMDTGRYEIPHPGISSVGASTGAAL